MFPIESLILPGIPSTTDSNEMTDPHILFRASRSVVEVIRTKVSLGRDSQLTIPQAAIVCDLPELAEPPTAKYLLAIASLIMRSAHG